MSGLQKTNDTPGVGTTHKTLMAEELRLEPAEFRALWDGLIGQIDTPVPEYGVVRTSKLGNKEVRFKFEKVSGHKQWRILDEDRYILYRHAGATMRPPEGFVPLEQACQECGYAPQSPAYLNFSKRMHDQLAEVELDKTGALEISSPSGMITMGLYRPRGSKADKWYVKPPYSFILKQELDSQKEPKEDYFQPISSLDDKEKIAWETILAGHARGMHNSDGSIALPEPHQAITVWNDPKNPDNWYVAESSRDAFQKAIGILPKRPNDYWSIVKVFSHLGIKQGDVIAEHLWQEAVVASAAVDGSGVIDLGEVQTVRLGLFSPGEWALHTSSVNAFGSAWKALNAKKIAGKASQIFSGGLGTAPLRKLDQLTPEERALYSEFYEMARNPRPEKVQGRMLALIRNPSFPHDAVDSRGRTLLQSMCDTKKEALALAMIQAGAPLNVCSDTGDSLLITACERGIEKVALALLDKGAPLNIFNQGRTALHVSCSNRLQKVAIAMIERGALLYDDAWKGYAPLSIACDQGLESVALSLIDHGAPLRRAGSPGSNIETAFMNRSDRIVLAMLAKEPELIDIMFHDYQPSATRDMLRQFANFVLLPALVNDASGKLSLSIQKTTINDMVMRLAESSEVVNAIVQKPSQKQIEPMRAKAEQLRSEGKKSEEIVSALSSDPSLNAVMQQLFRGRRLADCWHHPAIGLPASSLPLTGGREWYPLFKPFEAKNGLVVSCLTTSDALAEESKQLDHCVGRNAGYDLACCSDSAKDRIHILSIHRRNPDGSREAISTLHVQMVPLAKANLMIGDDNYGLRVVQHYGHRNSEPPPEAKAAWTEFLAATREKKVKFQYYYSEELGETPKSIQKFNQNTRLERAIGYRPTIESVNDMFDRFRMSERAAILGVNPKNNHRIYDTSKSEDGYTHYEHFIDGWAVIDEKGSPSGKVALRGNQLALDKSERMIPLRDLNVDSWLSATGIRYAGRKIVEEFCTKKPEWMVDEKLVDVKPRPILDESRPRAQVYDVQRQNIVQGRHR